MTHITATERVAHGEKCDGVGCDVLIPVRNEASKAPGLYVTIERVSANKKDPTKTDKSGTVFFHDKECMLSSLNSLSYYYSGVWKEVG